MAKASQTIECMLPGYQSDRKEWRRQILNRARKAAIGTGRKWTSTGPFEVVVLLYLTPGKQYDKHDVDNRLKDVLDGLQGAFNLKAEGKKRAKGRVIRNDASVCRVIVEKQPRPKKYRNSNDPPGGRLLIRPYRKHRWPLQMTKAGKNLRRRKPVA